MKRMFIITLLLLVLFILMFATPRARVPGETSQKEQTRIQGMSIANDVSL